MQVHSSAASLIFLAQVLDLVDMTQCAVLDLHTLSLRFRCAEEREINSRF